MTCASEIAGDVNIGGLLMLKGKWAVVQLYAVELTSIEVAP
ncbi:hypothetical protein [Candidatus Liberibacter sp.]|nr:hypothetical protein [Candidatus Liberibacter sp.]